MVTSFAIVINLPESLGSKEAKKIILDLSRVKTDDGVCGIARIIDLHARIARYSHRCRRKLRVLPVPQPPVAEEGKPEMVVQLQPVAA
jgi:hypothetical protein